MQIIMLNTAIALHALLTPVPQHSPRRRPSLPPLYHCAPDRKRGAVSPLLLFLRGNPRDGGRCPRDEMRSGMAAKPPLSWGRFLVCAGRGEGGAEMGIWLATGVRCLLCFAGIHKEGGMCRRVSDKMTAVREARYMPAGLPFSVMQILIK